MQHIAPLGPVYQAGTLSGKPDCHGSRSCLPYGVEKAGNAQCLAQQTEKLALGLKALADKHHVPFVVNYVGGMFGIFFTEQKTVSSYQAVMACDTEKFNRFFHAMLAQGIYLAPSAFEAGFMSLAHSDQDIERTLQAADQVFSQLA